MSCLLLGSSVRPDFPSSLRLQSSWWAGGAAWRANIGQTCSVQLWSSNRQLLPSSNQPTQVTHWTLLDSDMFSGPHRWLISKASNFRSLSNPVSSCSPWKPSLLFSPWSAWLKLTPPRRERRQSVSKTTFIIIFLPLSYLSHSRDISPLSDPTSPWHLTIRSFLCENCK